MIRPPALGRSRATIAPAILIREPLHRRNRNFAVLSSPLLRLRLHAIAKPHQPLKGLRHDSLRLLAVRPRARRPASHRDRSGRACAGSADAAPARRRPEEADRPQARLPGGQAGSGRADAAQEKSGEKGRGQEGRRQKRRREEGRRAEGREIRRGAGRRAGDPSGELRRLEHLRLAAGPRQGLLRSLQAQRSAAEGAQARFGLPVRVVPSVRERPQRDRGGDGLRRQGRQCGGRHRQNHLRARHQGPERLGSESGRGEPGGRDHVARPEPRSESRFQARQQGVRHLFAERLRPGARPGAQGVLVTSKPLTLSTQSAYIRACSDQRGRLFMASASLDIANHSRRAASAAVRTEAIEKTAGRQAPAGAAAGKPSLAGLTRDELKEKLAAIGVPERELRMRVGQLWHWIYLRGIRDFEAMSNVGKGLRQALADAYTLDRPAVVSEQVSQDGTRKWLLRMPSTGPLDKGAEIECVYIPEVDRGTLCVSSQVGCTLTCSFCHTGTQRLVRNLTHREIAAQLVVARDRIGDWPDKTPPEGAFVPNDGGRFISNVVFMGMGEPLYNLDNVVAAIGVISDNEGLGLSRRRITVSTSGVVPQIERLGAEANAMLAISLHAVRDDLRDELVPLNRKYPIAALLEACRAYPGLSNARRITFEYVMLKGVNDSDADARELVRLLKGIPAKINLIPFNPWPGAPFERSTANAIRTFGDFINREGYASPVRTPRGEDIMAACGQLKSDSLKLSAAERAAMAAVIAEKERAQALL